MKTTFLLVLCVLCTCANASITVYVPGDKSLQEAINSVPSGATIVVAPGVYSAVVFHGGGSNTAVIKSADPYDPAVVAATVIDGGTTCPAITFCGYEEAGSVLQGFTIQRGYGTNGGGINGNGTRATIRGCVIKNNRASYGGGLANCQGTIENSVIAGNTSDNDGAGFYQCSGVITSNTITNNISLAHGAGFYQCSGVIEKNRVIGNQSTLEGSGIYDCDGTIRYNVVTDGINGCAIGQSDGEIYGNVIAGNLGTMPTGGVSHCNASLVNNVIVGNSGQGVFFCWSPTIKNNIVWGNSEGQFFSSNFPTFCCIQGWTSGGEGNISDDPEFVDMGNRDFHLRSGSPCIDAGQAVTGVDRDIDGERRPQGEEVDIGVDEVPPPSAVNSAKWLIYE